MNTPHLSRGLALLFQGMIVLLGIAVVAALLVEPHFEGRNANASTFEIYFKDPFLAYVYVGSIPFFVALVRAFGLFGSVRRNGTFSQSTVDALRVIQRCAYVILAFLVGAVAIILMFGDGEDRPGGIFMSLLVGVATTIVALTAAALARNLRRSLQQA